MLLVSLQSSLRMVDPSACTHGPAAAHAAAILCHSVTDAAGAWTAPKQLGLLEHNAASGSEWTDEERDTCLLCDAH